MALYLGIPSKNGLDWDQLGTMWWEIVPYLELWLRQANSRHNAVPVVTISSPRAMTVWDGLVYLVGDPEFSVVWRAGGPETGDGGVAGQTSRVGSEMISEVYVNAHSSFGIAATVFHELMHNKFMNLYNFHRTPGNFTSATAPYSLPGPNAFDLKLMSAALTAPSKQYQDRF